MKKYVLLFSFCLLSFSIFAQNFDSLISKTEKEQFLSQENKILMLLFDGIEITNQHQENEVKWKPNFYENRQVVNFDDDFAYTGLDTVFFYLEGDTKKAVAIFATYAYENDRVIDCHSCAPTISVATFTYYEKTKKWQIDKFEKFYGIHGQWGEIQAISFKQIGVKKSALIFEVGFAYMGETTYYEAIYDLSKFEKIKTIKTRHDNLGYYDDRFKEKQIEIIKKIEFDKTQVNENGYYDLIVTTKNKNSTKVEIFEYENLEGYVIKNKTF